MKVKSSGIRVWALSAAAVAVATIATVSGTYVVEGRQHKINKTSEYHGPLAHISRQSDGSILMAADTSAPQKPTLHIYEDFQCPICREFEKTSGGTIKRLAALGRIRVIYTPIWRFKGATDARRPNSMRAAIAALCAPAPSWMTMHDTLYAHQPEEGTVGFTNPELLAWAKSLRFGDQSFETCTSNHDRIRQLDQMTSAAYAAGVQRVPTAFFNGQKLDLKSIMFNPKALEKTTTSR